MFDILPPFRQYIENWIYFRHSGEHLWESFAPSLLEIKSKWLSSALIDMESTVPKFTIKIFKYIINTRNGDFQDDIGIVS